MLSPTLKVWRGTCQVSWLVTFFVIIISLLSYLVANKYKIKYVRIHLLVRPLDCKSHASDAPLRKWREGDSERGREAVFTSNWLIIIGYISWKSLIFVGINRHWSPICYLLLFAWLIIIMIWNFFIPLPFVFRCWLLQWRKNKQVHFVISSLFAPFATHPLPHPASRAAVLINYRKHSVLYAYLVGATITQINSLYRAWAWLRPVCLRFASLWTTRCTADNHLDKSNQIKSNQTNKQTNKQASIQTNKQTTNKQTTNK